MITNVRADAAVNTFQLKLVDASGDNVWWVNRPDFTFPREWQLVRIEDGAGRAAVPDVKAKYTLEFDALGRFDARVDCNRVRGRWASHAPGQLLLGPFQLERAGCARGSLHDYIVKQLPNVRSYVVRDDRLFLVLVADGGLLEFEPATFEKMTVP